MFIEKKKFLLLQNKIFLMKNKILAALLSLLHVLLY